MYTNVNIDENVSRKNTNTRQGWVTRAIYVSVSVSSTFFNSHAFGYPDLISDFG